jgi:hypothetical protein
MGSYSVGGMLGYQVNWEVALGGFFQGDFKVPDFKVRQ